MTTNLTDPKAPVIDDRLRKRIAELRRNAEIDRELHLSCLPHSELELAIAEELLATRAELQEHRKAAEPVGGDELDQLIWGLERYGLYPRQLAALKELREWRKAVAEPVADVVAWSSPNEERTCDIRWRRFDVAPGPLYTAPPAPVVPPEWSIQDAVKFCKESGRQDAGSAMEAWNACRAAMLQAGNSPVTPDGWIPVSEAMPGRDIDVQVYCSDKKEQMVAYMERNEVEGWFRFASLPNGGGVYCKPTHWKPLPEPPVK